MQELRFVAVSEDGRYAVLAVPGRSARFTLPIDERLRAVALGQTSRLAQYEIEVESPLRPKEIQARIRAGETVEEIADAAGIAVERVRWFEGPVLAERAYVAEQARRASVRRQGESAPATQGPPLGEITTQRLEAVGADPEDAQWDAKKRGDGNWQVQLTFTAGGRLHVAEWVFDPRRRHLVPADDTAARMSLPGAEALPPAFPSPFAAAPPRGEATVTQLAPRLSAASRGGAPHVAPPPRPQTGQPGRPAAIQAPEAPAPAPAPAPVREPAQEPTGNRGDTDDGRDDYSPAVPAAPAPAPVAASIPAPAAPIPANAAAPVPADAAAPIPAPAAAPTPADAAAPIPAPAAATIPADAAATIPADAAATIPAPAAATIPADAAATIPADAAGKPDVAQQPDADHAAPATLQAPPAEDSPAAAAEPAVQQAGRAARKSARGRRSSVPSWDEIMFGSNRQRD
jgi:Protein of unknown function (DUF3071)